MSNNNYSENETTFWEFISDYKIEIPIVQRDYAQGRLGEEYLRKSFLTNLKQALDGDLPNGEKKLKLDFVYGSTEQGKMHQKNKMLPLDGQQRLTTLWLLHWYIALMAEKLNEDTCKCLNKFSYETRITSREFCKELCNPNNFTDFYKYKPDESRRIVSYIKSRTWFYSAWNQDPTIQSMLRMLGGTKITNKKGEDILDGIEELFEGTDIDKFNDYCENLISPNNAPIVFYHLPLKDFGLSDDLYIKMNARGKQLTSFENFKADLNGYIKQQAKNEVLDKEQQNKWGKLLDPKEGIPILMDTKWTDIFWEHKSTKSNIDEIYFAFLNRFFLNELICMKEDGNYMFTAEALEKDKRSFSFLYGKEGNDSNILYQDLEKYRFHKGEIPFHLFRSLKKVLDRFPNENLNDFFPKWVQSDFQFIPRYSDKSITSLGQKERVVFCAIVRYLENGLFEIQSFQQWMRVVWNVVENAGIGTISAMISVIRLIDEISCYSHSIYMYLADKNFKINSDAAKEQIKEEIAKAIKINNDSSWELKIIEAEKCKYLLGKIWVLFQNREETSLDIFEKRYSLLQTILNNQDKYYLPKILISYYDKEKPKCPINLKKDVRIWKDLLTNKDKGLFDCFQRICENEINPDIKFQWIKDIATTQLLNNSRNDAKIVSTYGKSIVLWGTSGCKRYVFSNEVWGNVIIGNYRNLLLDSEEIKLQNKELRVPNTNFVTCFDINFKYKDYFFQWYGSPNNAELDIYLMKDKWSSYKKRPDSTSKVGTDEDVYYCFKVEGDMTSEAFIKELDKLIEQAKQDNPANNDSGSSESGETQES